MNDIIIVTFFCYSQITKILLSPDTKDGKGKLVQCLDSRIQGHYGTKIHWAHVFAGT